MSIIKSWNNKQIRIREDRYVSLTDMAQATSKLFADWKRLKSSESYLVTLSTVMGIPITELVQVVQGGVPEFQGTWGHPKVAIRFAQWCSDEFAVQIDTWIDELLTTGRVQLHQPTATELIAMMAQQMVEQERAIKEQGRILAQLVAEKEKAEEELSMLPLSEEKPQDIPGRGKINWIVRSHSQRTHAAYQATWSKLYLELYCRYKYDVKARCRNSGLKPLDQIEKDGMIEALHAIASEILC